MNFPPSDDPLVQALQRLVEREGGYSQVAGTGVNDQTIYQIVMCKPDSKTKKPKGVGPRVRRHLDQFFPDWLSTNNLIAAESPPPWRPNSPAAPSLRDALSVVLDALLAAPAARRASVRAQIEQLSQHPELRREVLHELHSLLAPPSHR